MELVLILIGIWLFNYIIDAKSQPKASNQWGYQKKDDEYYLYDIWQPIICIFYKIAASDGIIDKKEEDALYKDLVGLARLLTNGDEPQFNQSIESLNFEIEQARRGFNQRNLDEELLTLEKCCENLEELRSFITESAYSIFINCAVADLTLAREELKILSKINKSFDIYNKPDLLEIKENTIFKLSDDQIMFYYENILPSINYKNGKAAVNSYINKQYSRWKSTEQSRDEKVRSKSINIQKEILKLKKIYR